VLEDCVMPWLDDAMERELAALALRLCAVLPWHAGMWGAARDEGWAPSAGPATTAANRAELLTRIDVLVGRAFGFTSDAVHWITRGCDAPIARLRRGTPAETHAKGFWRLDRTLAPADRRPNRWLARVVGALP